MRINSLASLGIAVLLSAPAFAQQMDCPMHAEHMSKADGSAAHGAGVDKRHDTMGFSHDATRHSFRLFDDGAAIELSATNDSDGASIAAIRSHIRTIAGEFQANDFSTPMFVHDKTPDGIDAMRKLHDKIDFRYEELPAGARVRMTTSNAEALAALHQFMRFQIVEHRTADSGSIEHEQR